MSKNVYIVISDLHDWSNNKNNRIDYLEEIDYVKDIIMQLVKTIKQKGNKVFVLFLGDIFDRGFKSIIRALQVNNYFVALDKSSDGIYSVVGNHETTYYKDNPFWALIGELGSPNLSKIKNKRIEPKGDTNVINVVDELRDGNVSFYFNHSGLGVEKPSNKTNILLSHNNLTTSEILESQLIKEDYESKYIDIGIGSILNGYSLVYLGHEHKRYSKVKVKDSLVHNLASLGRTNIGEVDNRFLERTIPIITVNNGELESVEDFKFDLLTREECVVESKVQQQAEKRILDSILKDAIKYKPRTDNPLNNIRSAFGHDDLYDEIIDGLVSNKEDAIYKIILKENGNE